MQPLQAIAVQSGMMMPVMPSMVGSISNPGMFMGMFNPHYQFNPTDFMPMPAFMPQNELHHVNGTLGKRNILESNLEGDPEFNHRYLQHSRSQ